MSKKKLHIQEVVTNIINHETGEEQIEKRTNVGMFEKEPPYVKTYISDIQRLMGFPNYVNDILLELLSNMGYNNIIPMYAPIKNMICSKLNISINTLNKAVDELYKKGILIRAARGMYIVDPNIFGRGSWQDIKNIRMTIEYDAEGNRSISSEFKKKLKDGTIDNQYKLF